MRSLVLAAAVCLLAAPGVAQAEPWGPALPPHPFLGPTGSATMHGDAGSSDTTPYPGPGTEPPTVRADPLAAACPTLLQGRDGLVVALCTAIAGQAPAVHLLDPEHGSLAALPLVKGSLLGGVYAYLDQDDRLVAVDGERALVRVAHHRDPDGRWRLAVAERTDLSGAIPQGDSVTGLVPDWSGNVWFATGKGVVGVHTPAGRTGTVELGEQVANSISAAPDGHVAVATTHALYELTADDGVPRVAWRAPYDRGSARKPGQLSHGTGSTPTYFGPGTGAEYLTVVDNADGGVRVLVFRSGTGEPVCAQPVLTAGGPGSENSPIGAGRSVFVAGTYGYPYPTVPGDAGPAVPPSAPFTGGMTRVDIDETGCHTVWESGIRSAAVPHLSTADGRLYTLTRHGPDAATPADGFSVTVLDPATGAMLADSPAPGTVLNDPLQMSPLILPDGRMLQGTVTGVLRIG
ncbi:hypothetical protein [Nocardia asteroides]|uniref:hypothetical protein n=1 Tax=Nocardia asteroides TaxID=1824 RepID=UPI001E2C23E1|nr:hypothetical protein [Nocardia asteroides]UGT62781.1 hypothetical protein LTT61_05430 [Nocardia asteroides]